MAPWLEQAPLAQGWAGTFPVIRSDILDPLVYSTKNGFCLSVF